MKKNSIIAIILIIALIAIVVFLDLPAYNRVSFLRKEIKTSRVFLEERQELIAKVEQLKEIYDSREKEIGRVYYVLPLEKDIPNLIVQFEALATENGLVLEKIDFIEKTIKKAADSTPQAGPQKEYKSLEVSLSLSGSYESLKSFLEALEYNIRLADIKSINFSSEKGLEGGSIFTFGINLEVYYQ